MTTLSRFSMLVLIVLAAALPGQAQEQGCIARAGGNVNLRYGPDTLTYGVAGVLAAGESLAVDGRSADGGWYTGLDSDSDGDGDGNGEVRVWVAAEVVAVRGACDDLPVHDAPPPPETFNHLMRAPVLPETLSQTVFDIFARGQALGNDPQRFTKIGDCNTDSPFFLLGFDMGYYDLGPYEDLQASVDYFAGSFGHESLAGQVGYNAHTVLDPIWADLERCEPHQGEAPLACEYRRYRPAVMVLMLGPNDLINLSEAQFEESMRGIVELSMEEGVIPVLTTFTWHRDHKWRKALKLNLITVELAQEHELPLINLWRAAQDLPGYGLVTDYTHLTGDGPGVQISFNGEEAEYGHTLRNLLTLQMLDMLREQVLDPAP